MHEEKIRSLKPKDELAKQIKKRNKNDEIIFCKQEIRNHKYLVCTLISMKLLLRRPYMRQKNYERKKKSTNVFCLEEKKKVKF